MKVKICVGTTCHLMGAPALIESLETFEKDIKSLIEPEYATCFAVCQGQYIPPVVQIGEEYFGNMTPTSLKKIVQEKLKKGE